MSKKVTRANLRYDVKYRVLSNENWRHQFPVGTIVKLCQDDGSHTPRFVADHEASPQHISLKDLEIADMAAEPTNNTYTPSAAELAEALRRLVDIEPGATIAAETLLARYDAAQKSPLDALLAWAPGPWEVRQYCLVSGENNLAVTVIESDDAGHDQTLLCLLAAAPQMLQALQEANEHLGRDVLWKDSSMLSQIKNALRVAGDKP